MPEPKRPGIPTLGVCPPDGQKALSERHMIPDGLLADVMKRHLLPLQGARSAGASATDLPNA
jgi:hypothetical protein